MDCQIVLWEAGILYGEATVFAQSLIRSMRASPSVTTNPKKYPSR